ncbi:1-(5-phosphoribosyl)-5-amino-4-imidazole-carboxylate carboxylase [Endomicrobiia bacterium]|nr:1-(5-phosphoribosyl)-5-amino-4-imidazole-carboxylate carboxylase [Endomicrobiia bacterium]GHT13604.1 1-(5-phosphoribosyl)-5-amino-4-imidazole-carboxylate carboxylase [Endomicrobiia bacterium]GHT18985.1 1-(5-phosphoribosyl)-5-amino-4-imidazole-carboxylate carboxylase [Endomicrobiia bacterium]GHT28234.1 1-(5-phosphoribosyl)-5-amino-4-imidazole-carboxylate carboxylase [Endomicrobiia bacterium]GHT30933.1 1-(5-phosphoribosyl)-5-amino-4-imidazole-carboxylate carboxylase [Endomicrobiia bacterium]
MNKANRKEQILELLKCVKDGQVSPDDALLRMQTAPFEDLGYANIDYHRGLRQGTGEVIYGQNKTPVQIRNIIFNMLDKGSNNIIITRISRQTADFLIKQKINLEYHNIAKLAVAERDSRTQRVGSMVIASGGTSDIPICEEAAITAEILGSLVIRLYDVGVAGLHRLLSQQNILAKARVIVTVAGMEGALASVIGGLVSCPVIAVPTSIGYGSNFNGLSALLAMLNSCANGISVVNIDNGFGAGYIANRINKMETI